jgi:hypothetical protein
MGFRFRRSVRLLPGIRINLSSSGPSVSVGRRGFHYTIGPKGTRVTAGIPGAGLSWTHYSPYEARRSAVQDTLPSELNFHPAGPRNYDQLQTIQNASADKINSLSTSELAPILNSASRRFRLAPAILLLCVLLFVAALLQSNPSAVGFSALFATVSVPMAIFLDRYRRSVRIRLEPEGVVARIAEALSVAFTELMDSEAIWIVHAEGRTSDWKRNAGATSLSSRKKTRLQFSRPSCIRGRARFPSFQVGADELYLLPDAALIIVRGEVASVTYRELELSSSVVRFIEADRVPSDTAIADHTWRYVNKSGGPDRRFINNAQLPVCLYGELILRSEGGLDCKFQLSKPSATESLYKVIEALKRITVEIPKSVTYAKAAKRWPTIVFICVFALLALVQVISFRQSTFRKFDNSYTQQSPSQTPTAPVSLPSIEGAPNASNKNSASSQPASSPFELKPPATQPHTDPTATTSPDSSQEAIDLNDAQNARWVRSRLQELGFLRGGTNGWDSFSRSALRDFKAANNLANDDKWDFKTEELLASGSALRVEQTFVGSWSEANCEPGSKPDIIINSRRAISSAGGTCEFLNLKSTGTGWIVGTTCSNAGEKWTATVRLAVSGSKLIWVGRDGTPTQYSRCG